MISGVEANCHILMTKPKISLKVLDDNTDIYGYMVAIPLLNIQHFQ